MAHDARSVASTRTDPPAISLATRELSPREARAAWTSTITDVYCDADVDVRNRRSSFDAEWVGRPFGSLHVSSMRVDPHKVLRTPAMTNTDDRSGFLLCVVKDGVAEVEQDGRSSRLSGGAFALLDTGRPFVFSSPVPMRQVVVHIPRLLLTSRLPSRLVRGNTAQAVSGSAGAGALVSTLVQAVAEDHSQLSVVTATAMSTSAVDMLVAAITDGQDRTTDTESAHARDLHRAQQAIAAQLHDPDFSVVDVAAELGMSVRYLQKLFSEAGTTPRAWLYLARLERARTMLLTTDATLTEVSCAVGFSDVSHFSRSFRQRFAASPGEYRREHRGLPLR